MRPLITFLLGALASVHAWAAPIPSFDSPRALLEAIYGQIEASQDWETFDSDAAFRETEAFSARLTALYEAADAEIKADGSEIGVLDFSPFINGQESGGMTFAVGEPKVKGGRAAAVVEIGGHAPQQLRFELVDDGAAGWKVDDIILPGYDGGPDWRLSEYFADPR